MPPTCKFKAHSSVPANCVKTWALMKHRTRLKDKRLGLTPWYPLGQVPLAPLPHKQSNASFVSSLSGLSGLSGRAFTFSGRPLTGMESTEPAAAPSGMVMVLRPKHSNIEASASQANQLLVYDAHRSRLRLVQLHCRLCHSPSGHASGHDSPSAILPQRVEAPYGPCTETLW